MKLARTKSEMKRIVEIWKRAGVELEEIRRRELRGLPFRFEDVDALLELGDYYDGPPRQSSGLVEMHRLLMKGARRMGKLPSSVCEEQAQYGSEIPEAKRKAIRVFMGADAPSGLFHLGNVGILESFLTAFFCSVRCPGNLISESYDLAQKWRAENQPVIGGFHSPVEREVLKIMLRSTVPVCIVPARSLPKRIPVAYRRGLDEGRLLLLSPFGAAQAGPFDARTKRATQESAALRNRVVASLAAKVFVAYAAPGSKTEAFCREMAGGDKPSAGLRVKPCLTFDDPKTANLREMGFQPVSL